MNPLTRAFGGSALAMALAATFGVSAPADAQQIYWADSGANPSYIGAIYSADLDGSNQQTVIGDMGRLLGIGVDPATGHAYYTTNAGPGPIGRVELGSATDQPLITGHASVDRAQHLALDLAGGKMYWSAYEDGIYRANLDGSNIETVFDNPGVVTRQTALGLDLPRGHVYYGNPSTGDLYRNDLTGGNHQVVAAGFAGGGFTFNALAIDSINERIYYGDSGAIRSAALDGSDSQVVVSDVGVIFGLAVYGDEIFWTDATNDHIAKAGLDGTGFEVLVSTTDAWGLTVIPEPGTVALMLASGAALLVSRRRDRHHV